MNTGSPWLDSLKQTLEEEPRPLRKNSRGATPPTVQNMQKSEEKAWGEVVNINTAPVPRTEDERRLLAAGWSPKGRMGLTIWVGEPRDRFLLLPGGGAASAGESFDGLSLLEAFDCTRGKREDTVSIHAAISRERKARALALLEGPSPNLAKQTP